LIASEDTRVTRKLLSAFNIPCPRLIAVHAHNEHAVADEVIDVATDSEVALVSDAGTPGLSDPGCEVVSRAHERGVKVYSVPGPSALASALALSGFPAIPSSFLGFPPRKGREGWCQQTLVRPETLVLFESPKRVRDLAVRLAKVQGDRMAAMCREISKRHEQVVRGTLSEVASFLTEQDRIRGECVLVIGPGQSTAQQAAPTIDPSRSDLGEVSKVLARRCGVTKRDVYRQLLDLESELANNQDD